MIGPVVHQEMLLGSRRNKLHVLRWVYGAWLVLWVLGLYLAFLGDQLPRRLAPRSGWDGEIQTSAPEVVGRWFCDGFLSQQVILLLLITPPFVAGAITDEKRRGTLQYLLLSDMETRHIILGKLVGRVCLLGLVMLAGLPLFGLLAGFAGVDPICLGVAGASLILPLIGLASATLLASVWCKQTRDAVLALYGLGVALGLLIYLASGPFAYLNPLFVIEPGWQPFGTRDLAEAGQRLLIAALAWGAITALCLTLAILRLRAVYVKEIESVRPTATRWFTVERPPVGDNPVRWREQNVEGLAPNATLRRVPIWLGVSLVSLLTTASSLAILYFNLKPGVTIDEILRAALALDLAKLQALLPNAAPGFLAQSIVAMLLASSVVGIRLSGAITSEREKQTWEAVLLTPLSAKSIVRAKLWGVLLSSLWYLLAYAAPATILSSLGGPASVVFTLIGLAVTCLAMYFIGATGLYCSATSSSSWRALLWTTAIGYIGGAVIYLVTSPVIVIISLLVLLALRIVDYFLGTTMALTIFNSFALYLQLFVIASWIGLAVLFFWLARLFLDRTLRWIADRERTRHWNDLPLYRRPRRSHELPSLSRDV